MADVGSVGKDNLQWIKDLADIINKILKTNSSIRTEYLKKLAAKENFANITKNIVSLTEGGVRDIGWCSFSADQRDEYNYVIKKLEERRRVDNEKGMISLPYITNMDAKSGAALIYIKEDDVPLVERYCVQYALERNTGEYNHRLDIDEYSRYLNGQHVCVLKNIPMNIAENIQLSKFGAENSFPFTTTVNMDGTVNIATNERNLMFSKGMDVLTAATLAGLDVYDKVEKYERQLERKAILNENKETFYIVPLDGGTSEYFLSIDDKGVNVHGKSGAQIKHIGKRDDDPDGYAYAAQIYEYLGAIKDPCIIMPKDIVCENGQSIIEILGIHVADGSDSDFVRRDESGNFIVPRQVMSEKETAKADFTITLIKEIERQAIREEIVANMGRYEKVVAECFDYIFDGNNDDPSYIPQFERDFKDAFIDKLMKNGNYLTRESYQLTAKETFEAVLDSANGIFHRLNHNYRAVDNGDVYSQIVRKFNNDITAYRNDPVIRDKKEVRAEKILGLFDTMAEDIKADNLNNLPSKVRKCVKKGDVKNWLGEIRESFNEALNIERDELILTSERELADKMKVSTDLNRNIILNNYEQARYDTKPRNSER